MKRFAVIGHPIAHSRSPEIHQLFASQQQLDIRYERLLAPLEDFVGTAERFFAQGGHGLNVTVPFKTDAAAWVTELDLVAQLAGAVNTVVPTPQGYRGVNTDGTGLVADLTQNLGLTLRGQRLALLGAGGAAAGVLGALLALQPAQLVLANRTETNATSLAERFGGVEVRSYEALRGPFDLVVNATSVGLNPGAPSFAALVDPSVVSGAVCYDMLYGASAQFGRFALQAGATRVADGLGMLVEQAAAAFAQWHGQYPETGPVIAALRVAEAG